MTDLAAFAMYDGHTGVHVAEYSSKNLLDTIIRGFRRRACTTREACGECINRVAKAFSDQKAGVENNGCGRIIQRQLVVGNVGDTRVVSGVGEVAIMSSAAQRASQRCMVPRTPPRPKDKGERRSPGSVCKRANQCYACRMCGCGRAIMDTVESRSTFARSRRTVSYCSIGDVQIQKSNPGVIISVILARTASRLQMHL